MKGDVSTLLFRQAKTQRACQIFLKWLKKHGCEVSPREVSQFTRDLQKGTLVNGFRYRRERFYVTILRRLRDFGFIAKQLRFGSGVVYAPVDQPIPKRAPLLTTWWGFAYLVADTWNRFFEESEGRYR